MPRYHFNVRDGRDYPDPDGHVLPDLDAARRFALRYTCELLGSLDEQFWSGEPWSMEVTDEVGLVLFRLDFAGTEAPSVAAMAKRGGTGQAAN